MSKLDNILEESRKQPITGLDPPAKEQIKDLMLELLGPEERNDYGHWLVDAEEITKKVAEL